MIVVTKEVIITKMGKIQFKIKIIQLQHQSEGILGQIEGIPEGGIEKKRLETKMFKKSHTQQFEKLLRLYPLFNHP